MVTRSYDVAVWGGGPAGAAAALALRRREPALRLALIEKTDYSTRRVGETLPPPVQRLLTELGVWDAFLRRTPLAAYGTRAVWGSAHCHESEFVFSPYGRGWHIDRRDFDAWLVDEAERAGVDVFRSIDARVANLHARFVIDATGRHSVFARSRGARHLIFDRLVGVVAFLRAGTSSVERDTYTTVEACEHGWWYTALLPQAEMAAVFMTDANLLSRLAWRRLEDWTRLTSLAPYTAQRISGMIALGEPSVHTARSQRLDIVAGDGWLAAGDAASSVDPLSSVGVMRALRSGVNAARAIGRHVSGHSSALTEYGARIAKEYDDYLVARATYYGMEQRWPHSPFWRCRHESHEPQPFARGGTGHAVHVANQHQEKSRAAAASRL